MSLREIEERHHNAERSGYNANAFGKQAHADRAFLLAEVRRLEGDLSVANLRLQSRMCSECPQENEVRRLTENIEDGARTNARLREEVARLKALCGWAAEHIGADCNDYCDKDAGGDCPSHALAAELKEAASE